MAEQGSGVAGKVVLVTGGASGLGQAAVGLLVGGGARVVVADLQRDRGEQVAAEARAGAARPSSAPPT